MFEIDAGADVTTTRSLVLVVGTPLQRTNLIAGLGIHSPQAVLSLVDCAIWHGDHQLDYEEHYPIDHGFGFLVTFRIICRTL